MPAVELRNLAHLSICRAGAGSPAPAPRALPRSRMARRVSRMTASIHPLADLVRAPPGLSIDERMFYTQVRRGSLSHTVGQRVREACLASCRLPATTRRGELVQTK